jgi:hypothetical protein
MRCYVANVGEISNAFSILVGNSEGNGPIAIRRHRWEDNIRKDFKEIEWK